MLFTTLTEDVLNKVQMGEGFPNMDLPIAPIYKEHCVVPHEFHNHTGEKMNKQCLLFKL